MSQLTDGAIALGVDLSPAQLAMLDQFAAFLRDGNKRANLTGITDPVEIETKHFLDSLTAALPLLGRLKNGEPTTLIDVGTGAGFPGIPIRIAFPHVEVTLVESTAKKVAFLREAAEFLQLTGVSVVHSRAETLAGDQGFRDQFDWATARAVGSLPVVIELCGPFLSPGGLLVAQRRGDLDAEVEAAAPAFSALRLWARMPIQVTLPGLADGRGLIVGEKHGPTPSRFPRRIGVAAKHPIA